MDTVDHVCRFGPKIPGLKVPPPDAEAALRTLKDSDRMFSRWMYGCRTDVSLGGSRYEVNRNGLEFCEPFPYMPHLTIVKADTMEEARKSVEIARRRWDSFKDGRKVAIDAITFVKGNGERWVDLVPVRLGTRK